MASELKKGRRKATPSKTTIQRKKNALGFKVHKIKKKPKLGKKLWAMRKEMAEKRICNTASRTRSTSSRTSAASGRM